jgi:hypothetical protein
MTAEERGIEMMSTPFNYLPLLAIKFSKKLNRKFGTCMEIFLTAWIVYAQCIEGLTCTTPLYMASVADKKWFDKQQEKLNASKKR